MSLQRTPPHSPAPAVVVAPAPASTLGSAVDDIAVTQASSYALSRPALQQLQHCLSAPSLTDNDNVSFRKRKRAEVDDSFYDFMTEMKAQFDQFRLDQDQFRLDQERKTDKICSAVEEIRSSVDFLAQKYEALQAKIVKMETERESDTLYIKSLEEKLEGFERVSRSTCLEIRNVPVSTAETKASLVDTFIKAGSAISVPIQRNDVKDIFRLNSKNPDKRTIIVDLNSVLLKEKVIAMFRNFNKSASRLTTEHLKIGGNPKLIYISENLTPRMKRLFFLARDFAKVNDFKFCWVSHGKIFLRKRENGPLLRVTNELDLEKAKSQK